MLVGGPVPVPSELARTGAVPVWPEAVADRRRGGCMGQPRTRRELPITGLRTTSVETSAAVEPPGVPQSVVLWQRDRIDDLAAALKSLSEALTDLGTRVKSLQEEISVIRPPLVEHAERIAELRAATDEAGATLMKCFRRLSLENVTFLLAHNDFRQLSMITAVLGFPMAHQLAVAEALLFWKRWHHARNPVAYLRKIVRIVYKANLDYEILGRELELYSDSRSAFGQTSGPQI